MKNALRSYFWFIWFAACFMVFQLITNYVRPGYSGSNPLIIYGLGVAPNFFTAMGIPALLVLILPQMNPTGIWFNAKKHLTANLISASGLIVWECLQAGSAKLHFDWNDILWTLIGAVLFQCVWSYRQSGE
ncbi:MAG: hypothetical protein IPH78_03670 [Bacteroidetes bacterium]|nr:hypothetical protein [Bacteroidota bacterium]